MRAAKKDHSSTKASMPSRGTPSVRHSAASCTRGSSPQEMRTSGTRNASPMSVSARQSPSGVRGVRRGSAADGVLPGSDVAATATGSSLRARLLADDIAALDFLLSLQADGQAVDVGIGLAAVVLDAID